MVWLDMHKLKYKSQNLKSRSENLGWDTNLQCAKILIQTETGPTVTLRHLYSVNVIAIIGAGSIGVNIVKLNVIVSFSSKLDGLVDLDRLGELAVGLQVPRLVCRVLQDHVRLGVLQSKVLHVM